MIHPSWEGQWKKQRHNFCSWQLVESLGLVSVSSFFVAILIEWGWRDMRTVSITGTMINEWWATDHQRIDECYPCSSTLFSNCSSSLFGGKTQKLSYLHQDPLNLLYYLGLEHQQNLNIKPHQQKSSHKSSKILGSSVFPGKFRPGRAIQTASAVFGELPCWRRCTPLHSESALSGPRKDGDWTNKPVQKIRI